MRKIFWLIISVVFVMLQLTGYGAMSCEHEYSSTVTKAATYDVEGEITYTCSKCNHTYTEMIPKLEKHIVPSEVLDHAVTYAKYNMNPFSITVGELVNSAMNQYKMKHYSGEDAISKGYLKKEQIDSSIDINYLYVAIISGDTKINPSLPYLTEYEAEAAKVWMIFDENDELINYGVVLCDNLETYAILMMTSGY